MRFLLRPPFILAILFAVDILCGGFFIYKRAEATQSAREILGDAVFFASDYPTPEIVLWESLSRLAMMIVLLLATISVVRFVRWNTREFFDSPAPHRRSGETTQ
jgi:hypothetical protein